MTAGDPDIIYRMLKHGGGRFIRQHPAVKTRLGWVRIGNIEIGRTVGWLVGRAHHAGAYGDAQLIKRDGLTHHDREAGSMLINLV